MKVENILKTTVPLAPTKKLVINLMLSSSSASTQMADALKVYDISLPQFNVLRILRGQQGKPANLSTIQERMINQMSNTTRLIDKLLEKDLVKRITCEKNRRKIEVFITDQGLDLLKEIDPIVDQAEKNISGNLTKNEIALLNDLLEKIRD